MTPSFKLPLPMGSVQCVQWNQLGKGTVASQIYEEQYAVMVYKAGHAKWYKIYLGAGLFSQSSVHAFIVSINNAANATL